MDDISVIEINDDADIDKIGVDEINVDKIDKIDKIDVDKIDFDNINVDKNDVDKIFTFDDIGDEPHNGKPITKIEISPHENYLITYSEEDSSIAGWNVEDIDKVQLKFHQTVKINKEGDEYNIYEIKSLCVSDDKKLAYVYLHRDYWRCSVIDMNNKDEKKIALNLDVKYNYYCTFNLKGEFILYSYFCFHGYLGSHDIIWIYSTQTKNNKWECKRFYRIPEDYELISISKYDNVYLFLNDYIYEWNINTEKSVKIFDNNKDKNKFETENIGIFSNEKFIFLKINDKIIVYSIELRIPIASLDIVNDKGIHNSIKYCWNNKYKNRLNQTLFDNPTDKSNDEQTKFVFGILNGRVWKAKFENSDELNKGNNKIIECNDDDKKTYKHLNVHSFNLYMDTVSTLFQKVTTDEYKKSTELTGNLIKWDVRVEGGKINLAVSTVNKHNTEGESISTRTENYPYKAKYSFYKHGLIASSLFNNNDIVILTTFGILIYTFSENNESSENVSSENVESSENNKSIFLNYFYFMEFDPFDYIRENEIYMEIFQHYKRIFSKSTLPLPNYDSFRLDGWVSDVINIKSSLLKYGVELLTFAIKEHKLELIDEIYKKCMAYFKEDLMNNKSFLSIITSTMPLLDKYYPEYILRYSSETNMIIDSSSYSIEHQNKNLHLCSFF
ncbi:uncharacterized protein OCT59_013355 [Rhizophagus irregularis]|nr:hypothetical protein OCT59_013355 [Rhizophagus irregularis]